MAHTTTNTQVEDVDEPDFVKTDGKRILVLLGGTLYVAKSWPPTELALTGSLAIEGQATEMFLDQDCVVVFSYVSTQELYSGGGACLNGCTYYGGNAVKITVVDIANASEPVVVFQVLLPGQYRSARRVGSSMRVILGDYFCWPSGVSFYVEYHDGMWDDLKWQIAQYEDLKATNRRVIRQTRLAQWLPTMVRRLEGGGKVDLPDRCTDFYRGNTPVKLAMATVVSLNLNNLSARPSRVTVVGGVDEIYANAQSLYLAGRHWWWTSEPGQKSHT